MPFVMESHPEGFAPGVRCDHCGQVVTAETGLVLWQVAPSPSEPGAIFLVCDQACADALAEQRPGVQLAALALDAYLAALVHETLRLDLAAVRAREEAAWAMERTRDQVLD